MSTDAASTTVSHRPLVWDAPEREKILSPRQTWPLLKAAVATAPDRTDLKRHFARALFEADRMTEIVDWLRPMIDSEEADSELLDYLGRAALACGDSQTARDALRLAAAKGFTGSLEWLAKAFAESGCDDQAIETAVEALQAPALDFRPLALLAQLLPPRGETERLWTLCAGLLARNYWGGFLPAAAAFAAAATRRVDELAGLMNTERWFFSGRLEMGGGFNERLSAELLANRELSSVHSSKATRGMGAWIDQIQIFGGVLAKDLLGEIRQIVQDYVARREHFAEDPIIRHKPERVRLHSWATVVRDDGYQRLHIHSSGWISGVYYVDVPEHKSSESNRDGDIEFGLHTFGNPLECADAPRWRIRPKAGMLLLFPSHYAHRTWPTQVSRPRSSIAFDVIPVQQRTEAEQP